MVEPEELLPRAVEIAEQIASNAPLAVRGTKAAFRSWRHDSMDYSYRLSEWIYRANIDGDEVRIEFNRAIVDRQIYRD